MKSFKRFMAEASGYWDQPHTTHSSYEDWQKTVEARGFEVRHSNNPHSYESENGITSCYKKGTWECKGSFYHPMRHGEKPSGRVHLK